MHKHTPWRAEDGYVCAGCLGAEVEALKAERDSLRKRLDEAHAEAQEAVNGPGGWRDTLLIETKLREWSAKDAEKLREMQAQLQIEPTTPGYCRTLFTRRCVRGAGHQGECDPEVSQPTDAFPTNEGSSQP